MIDGGLRQLFHHHLRTGFQWNAIESGATGGGIPDSEFCSAGTTGWTEFKKTETNAVGLRPLQVGWHKKRALLGGRSFIAVRQHHLGGPRRGEPIDNLFLYAGRSAETLERHGLVSVDGLLGCWLGGPSRWDWAAVRRILVT